MRRVAYIARYRHPTMERKIALIASRPGFEVLLVRPASWRDSFGERPLPVSPGAPYRTLAVPLIGRHEDPHRTLFRSVSFGLGRFHPHVVHTEEEPDSLSALQIALARKVFAPSARLVLHTSQNIDRSKRAVVRRVIRVTLGQADAMLSVNQEGVGVLRAQGYRGPIEVVPREGVDTDVFRPAPGAERATAGPPFTIVYAGRLAVEKGIETLIDATGKLEHVRLWIIGDGPHRAAVEARAAQARLRGRIEFIAPLSPDRLVERYRQADVLVLPSRTTRVWKERFGRVLVEAMACKVPPIGSDSGAIPEVIGDAGLIFPEGDSEALAARVKQLTEDATLRRTLADRGHARVIDRYSQDQVARQTVAFYDALLGGCRDG